MSVINGPDYITPTLDLNFAKSKNLKDSISGRELITYTRNSIGTYVGPDGLIKYAAANEPRFDHDSTTGECLGLLMEEARTNLVPSSDFSSGWNNQNVIVTPNAGIAPDGTYTAVKVASTVDNDWHNYSANNIGFADQRCISIFVKAAGVNKFYFGIYQYVDQGITVDLTNESITGTGGTVTYYGNGWYRLSYQVNYAGRRNIFVAPLQRTQHMGNSTDGILLWGPQYEDNVTFPTSYIPTKASTVTRSADSASITGTNFSSWYNQSEGTIFSNFNTHVKSYSSALQLYSIRNSTPTEFLEFYTGNTSTDGITLDVVGGRQFAFYSRSQVDNGKYALALKQNNFAISKNGATPLTDSNGLMPSSVDRFLIGGSPGGSYTLNGTISRFTYYPQRLPNTQLQVMTR